MTYLTPNFNKTFNTLLEALQGMKNPENEIYTSVIPNDVTYTVQEDKGFVVHFDKPLDLESLNASEASRLIEAFSLNSCKLQSNYPIREYRTRKMEWNRFN